MSDPISQVASKVVYENQWMTIREDEVQFRNSRTGIYSVLEKPDFALIIPVDADGFWLVRQFRYPVGATYWEFPQGNAGDGTMSAEAQAATELKEETGLVAGTMTHLGHLYEAYGYSNQGFDVYLAEDLAQGAHDREVTEQDMEARHVAFAEFERMVSTGDIKDAPTLSAYALYVLYERS